ncbi:MAG: mannose-1-phosphate guanylyltransferase [Planctomycetaceae bacterium]|nr:mannose-1-phosphate guanylyltransferase [Planctomycetaceae bacterium]
MLHAVILAGGSGTRFWPQSRRALPKQFLRFGSDRTLLQETVERIRAFIPPERTWVVTGSAHAVESARQLPSIRGTNVLSEPCGRNTAPCIGLAAIQLLATDPEAVMLVMPADHVIRPVAEFQRAVEQAVTLIARESAALVLFGVVPTYPATGFGYIQRGEALVDSSAFRVATFREKPDVATAAQYLAAQDFFWNCGLFVWRAATILEQLERHMPEIATRLKRLQAVLGTERWAETLAAEFPQMPSLSIDYAVLEKAEHVSVVPATFEWDDVGSWQALSRLLPADGQGNTIEGQSCAINTSGCIVRSSPEHLVATYGVRDLIIVHMPDATLVADKHDESALRQLIAELERRGLSEFL